MLAASVLSGKATGTNAPFIRVTAHGQLQGLAQSAGLGWDQDRLLPIDAGSPVALQVEVETAQWAQVDRVEFYVNSQPQRTSAAGEAARYGICADAVVRRGDPGWISEDVVVDERVSGAVRSVVSVTLTLPGVQEDTWVVAFARGSDGVSEPLFPVLPASLDQASNTTLDDLVDGNLGEGGTPAFAFTNPLFIDSGGDGWTAPGVSNAPCESPP